MSDSQKQPWSANHNTPKISYYAYLKEKSNFAGILIASILYGIMIAVFFQCMAALFDPVHRRGERTKWGLVSYTMVMFSFVTVFTATNLDIQSISYIDNREFPGVEGVGPFRYEWFISAEILTTVSNVVFPLNNWLADGLLLYRCYLIYSKNVWAVAFPSLMYLGSVAVGILFIYQSSEPTSRDRSTVPYISISLSLNVVLTLMIVIRLILRARNIRIALGGTGSGGLCKAIATMFIESCTLFTVNSLLVLVLMSAGSGTLDIFILTLPGTQAIASLFVIHRVANKSALTSNTLVSGRLTTFEVGSRGELTGGSDAVPGGGPASSVGERGMGTSEPGVGIKITNDSHHDEVY